jgi:protein phosphatase
VRIKRAAAVTHPGAKRQYNEDAVLRVGSPPLYAVADGMGGAKPGKAAADLAMRTVKEFAQKMRAANKRISVDRSTANRLALTNLLDELFNAASHRIQRVKTERSVTGMGATLVLVTVVRNFAYVAHVGDSRAYLVRGGRLIRLTEDHSLAEFRFRRGRITREEYETSQDRRLLYQALGAGVDVEVDVAEVRLIEGDALLLCSDGLTRALTEEAIAELVDPGDIDGSASQLISVANDAGAEDNVSVVLLDLESEEGDEPIESVTEVLQDVFLFKDITPTELLVIAPYLEEVVHRKGATVIKEGDPGDAFFVVVDGRVKISRGPTVLTEVKAGGHFGELALARPVRRSATVRTATRTRLFALSRDRFHELLRQKPGLGAKLSLALLDTVGDRLRDLSDRLAAVERAVRGEFR